MTAHRCALHRLALVRQAERNRWMLAWSETLNGNGLNCRCLSLAIGQPVDNPAKEKALHRCKALIFWLPGADSNHGPSD
jgi:hypothetical protein